MEVSIVNKTPCMVDTISFAAGVYYGKRDSKLSRLRSCYKVGHTGVLEHASVSFLVEGISRSCSHQLVRHRLASYCQESQRYCKYDLDGDGWYVIPPSVAENEEALTVFKSQMRDNAKAYMFMLESGIKPEDARFVLTESAKTSIMVTQNIRTIFHFFDLRLGPRAQWEIRELAEKMHAALAEVEPELVSAYDEFREQTRVD